MISDKLKIIFLVIFIVFFQGCKHNDSDSVSVVSGTISFDDAISVEVISRIEVMLVDYSIADASHIEIAKTTLTDINELPISYAVAYNDNEIKSANLYSISVDVYELNNQNTEVRTHTTMQSYPVLTQGFGAQADVLVQQIN